MCVCVSVCDCDWNEHINHAAQIQFIGVKFVKGMAQEWKLMHLSPCLQLPYTRLHYGGPVANYP